MNFFDYTSYMTESVSKPVFQTGLGCLWDKDCLEILPFIKDGVVDTVFADPPFNLGKKYGKNTNDSLPEKDYLDWCRLWISESQRILKSGGSFFLYNIPKWNIQLGTYLFQIGMTFRHWIAVDISSSLPIAKKLHPSHYSLLYFTKGNPKTFRKIKTPIETCRHCGGEIKDYGGHRHAMHNGVNLKDIWTDIAPVRHKKYKTHKRKANALSTKLLERVVEISTIPGEIVFDPFGGSGTTFDVCEYKNRQWMGTEIDFSQDIIERLVGGEIKPHLNRDIVDE